MHIERVALKEIKFSLHGGKPVLGESNIVLKGFNYLKILTVRTEKWSKGVQKMFTKRQRGIETPFED